MYFDDCFRYAGDLVDGDMKPGDLVEAKGRRYAHLLSQSFGDSVMKSLVDQARRQKAVADSRGVGLKWYFAEKVTANLTRLRFDEVDLRTIVVSYMPPRKRK